jgi:hypothetical protein
MARHLLLHLNKTIMIYTVKKHKFILNNKITIKAFNCAKKHSNLPQTASNVFRCIKKFTIYSQLMNHHL